MNIIINGKGGCGKDTLIEGLGPYIVICPYRPSDKHAVENVSSVDAVKVTARTFGWNGEKDDKSRKMLHDLKNLMTEYNNYPLYDVSQKIKSYHGMYESEPVCFIHIREPENISAAVRKFGEDGIKTVTLLIKRDKTDNKVYGNHADDDVESYDYDYEFVNEGNIGDSKMKFRNFIRSVVHETLYP